MCIKRMAIYISVSNPYHCLRGELYYQLFYSTLKIFIMKIKISYLLFALLISTTVFAQKNAVKVEVLYFHATGRCATCLAVENQTKAVLEQNFKNEFKAGTLVFKALNKEEEQNQKLVEKYEIAFSSLIIVRKEGAKESKIDFTDKAFQYARTNPTKYAELLKVQIINSLK